MDKPPLWQDLLNFFICIGLYLKNKFFNFFHLFEEAKSGVAAGLYKQRGRFVRPFVHSGMAFLLLGGITLGPILISENFSNPWENELPSSTVLSTAMAETGTSTLISQKPRAETIEYEVKPGDTVSTIAEKFGVSVDTIIWENDLKSIKEIKPGQKLKILPVTGVLYKIKPGETIYSIAKKLQVDAQVIVDWPYNSFANDETFALAVGQTLMVPDGIEPKEVPVAPKRVFATVPGAGLGTGQFLWPTAGRITQSYSWYHKALDIANSGLPDVLAADGGTVILAGWPTPGGYGNHIIINHGNGFQTLYGHLSQVYVSVGQKVARGQVIGKMGSTGRSTGPHLHLEIRQNGVAQNPLSFLK